MSSRFPPDERYRAARDIVRGEKNIARLPERPSSRWRYQFVLVADWQNQNTGEIIKKVQGFSSPLARTLTPASRRKMFDSAYTQAKRSLTVFSGDMGYEEEDIPPVWEMLVGGKHRIYRIVLVFRQYNASRGIKTLQPISKYLKPRPKKIRKRR